jgi:hypothetical protein
MIRSVLVGLVAGALASAAHAQATPALVESAVAAVEARAEPEQRWSFTRTMTLGARSLRAEFDPARPAEEAWRLVSPASLDELAAELRAAFEAFGAEETPDLNVVLGGESEEEGGLADLIGGGLRLVRDEGSRAVFAFQPTGEGLGGDGGGGGGDMARHLAGELIVATAAPMIESLRFFAEGSFKPNPAARITTLDVEMRFAEIEPGGPIAVASTVTHVAGSALFRSFDQTIEVVNADFVRAELVGAPQPAP